MSTTRARLAAAGRVGTCIAGLACSLETKGEIGGFMEPPGLSRPVAAVQRAALEYRLRPSSRAELAIGGGRGARLEGELPVTSGRLWLDASDLAATRASLTFDLLALRLWDESSKKLPPGAPSSTLTEQSLEWLQLARAADIQAHPELRHARFTLLGIGSSSSNDLDAAPTVRSGQPAVVARRVRLRASGELELHGHRLPQTVALIATFEWVAPGEPGAPPQRVSLETAEPLGVDLLAHGIVPRNARGELVADALAELRRLPRDALRVRVRARWVAELAEGSEVDGVRLQLAP